MRRMERNIVDGKDKRLIFRRGRRVAAMAFKRKVIPVIPMSESALNTGRGTYEASLSSTYLQREAVST